jgi:MFS transporter, DHA3 family, macrolide efflux protein
MPRSSWPPGAPAFALAHMLSAFAFEYLSFVLTVRVFALTGSAVGVATFAVLVFVPRLFAPAIGALTDRRHRGYLFLAACLLSAATTLAIAVSDGLTPLYAGWFVLSALGVAILNLRSVILTQIMAAGAHVRGNATMLVSLNAARLAAPPIGTLAGLYLPPAWALAVAAVAYALAGLLTLAVRVPDGAPAKAGSSPVRMRDGFDHLRRDPGLAFLALTSVFWRLALGFQGSLYVVLVARAFDGGTVEYGTMMTAFSVASLAGSLAGPFAARRWDRRGVVIAGLAVSFTASAGLGLAPAYSLVLALGAVSQFALYGAAVSIHSLRDGATPPDRRGRVFGCVTAGTAVATGLSTLAGGALADVLGVVPVFAGGGFLALIGLAAAWALTLRREVSPAPRLSASTRGS